MKKLLVLAGIALAIAAFFILDLDRFLEFHYLKARYAELLGLVRAEPLSASAIYFVAYVAITGLSLPGGLIMTLLGGALFGWLWALVLVSFAATLGATLAFLMSRFLLRDLVKRRFSGRLAAIDRGIEREGAFYLFTLRLVPAFPFFVTNLVMGITGIRLASYWWVTQLGMLPGTGVYVYAGTQFADVAAPEDILSPGMLIALTLLGLFPLVTKKTIDFIEIRKALAEHDFPKRFDANVTVIGAGSAGLVASYIAAATRAKVTLIEKNRMGGDCLNTGCVPSKALLRTARFLAEARRAEALGLRAAQVDYDFAEVMMRVQRVISRVEPHDSPERYRALGVDVVHGEARITSPYSIEVAGRELTTRAIVVAAGAAPRVPAIDGLSESGYLTSDTLWELRQRPDRLVVLGGGPVGCELSQGLARLGVRVTLVELGDRLMPREDAEVSQFVLQRLRAEGITVWLGCETLRVRRERAEKVLLCARDDEELEIRCDEILLALGRVANVTGYGLEEVGVALADDGTLDVNEFLQTAVPTIFACGDVAGPYQFTHVAGHQAWYAAVNALFGSSLKRFKVDYRVIPRVTFTDPEIARVGLNETEARAENIAHEITVYELEELDRAIADDAAHGFVKVLTVPGKDRILGVTIVGEHAGELIAEYALAMRYGLGLKKILATVHAYPTFAEANKYAAGAWQSAHAPERLLRWLERFHRWRRG